MASVHDMDKARGTYTGFTAMVKWGTLVSIAAVALVIVLIT